MGFIEHIPGTVPLVPPTRDARALGVGVLGLHEGRTLLLALCRCSRAYAAAGCDTNQDKVDACAREAPGLFYTSRFEDMLLRPDVRVVAIYTPDADHGAHIEQAFEAGKDVICTKPLVNSVPDARRVLAAARRTGRRLLVGQSTRFFEPFRRQRAAFERGAFGRVELADAHYIHRMDWYYRKSPWAARATDWIFLGLSHPLDLLRWYLGPIRAVHAAATRSALGAGFDISGPDLYAVTVIAESGAIGRAMGHYGVHELPTARNCIELMLYGSGGSSLAQYHDMRFVYTAPGPADRSMSTEVTEDHLYAGRQYYFNSEVHGMHYGEFANYAEHFASAIIDGSRASPELEEGLEVFAVMESARRSAREGRSIDVRSVADEIGLSAAGATR
ncbi:MAG: Gfo/Idh/MocA family oxidoreductase [Phycisphaerae bacterium]|nr:Gfo/Idh/MocA family oxidoreductase [Phycisphaerae bacterium]